MKVARYSQVNKTGDFLVLRMSAITKWRHTKDLKDIEQDSRTSI